MPNTHAHTHTHTRTRTHTRIIMFKKNFFLNNQNNLDSDRHSFIYMNIQDIYNTQLVQKYNKYIHTCTKYISNLQHTVKTYLGFTKQFEQILLCFLK